MLAEVAIGVGSFVFGFSVAAVLMVSCGPRTRRPLEQTAVIDGPASGKSSPRSIVSPCDSHLVYWERIPSGPAEQGAESFWRA